MKKYLFIMFVVTTIHSYSLTTYTVGASGTYTTIAAAYAACTAADNYVIEIQNDYSYVGETGGTANITLTSLSNKSSTNTVTIRPQTGVTLSFSSTANSIFYLNAANWVIFDGRAGGSGSSAWTIVNTSNGSKSIFTFINDASNNTVKYCLLKGDGNGAGLITISGTTGTTGNDNNTIDNCTLRENSTFPMDLIYSYGDPSKLNSGNIVSNCHLINFTRSALNLVSNNTQWTIINNHFYQTSSISNFGLEHIFINIHNVTGTGYTITGNYFGGRAANCGGSSYVVTTTTGFIATIFFSSSSSGTVNTISGNTFSNLTLTGGAVNSGTKPPMALIYFTGSGDFIVGSSSNGNTFGSTSDTGNIVITYNNDNSGYSDFNCIQSSTSGSTSIDYNTFGAITFNKITSLSGDFFALIHVYQASGSVMISNNTLGNTIADNIRIKNNTEKLIGIYFDNTSMATATISSNTIQNFTTIDYAGASDGRLYGILFNCSVPITTLSINDNEIKYLTYNATNANDNGGGIGSGYFYGASVIGIECYLFGSGISANCDVYNNKIINLSSTYTGGLVIHVIGIIIGTDYNGTLDVYRNKIKGLSNASSNSTSALIGIDVEYYSDGTGVASLYNNVILLTDSYTSYSKTILAIAGGSYAGLGANINFYYNTARLETAYSTGSGVSAALYVLAASDPISVKNNIFQNLNSGGTDTHYSQYWDFSYGSPSSLAGIRYNYNEAPNTSKLIFYNSTDYTISGWRTLIGDGSNTELTGNISISSTTGVASSSITVGNAGTPIAGITTDYDLNARDATNPWMGAFESITALPIELLGISAKCQKSKTSNSEYGATVQWTTATEKNSDYFVVEGSDDGFVWEVKDTIDGSGTKYDPTNYYYHESFINPTPENETVVYFRVSQTDFDGVVKQYDILSCKCEASDKVKIHPVPATESIVINFGDQNNVPNSFQIMDVFGRIIEEVIIEGKEGNTSYELDISNYSSGRYIIKINDWKMKEDAVFIKK